MERKLYLCFKTTSDRTEKLKEEFKLNNLEFKKVLLATQKDLITEISTRLFPPNKIDLQPIVEQSIQEEESIENEEFKEKWILLDKQFVYGRGEEDSFQDGKHQEDDLTEKKEKMSYFKKQFNYGFEDQDKQRNFMVKRNRGLMQRSRWSLWIQKILQGKKKDLISGREALSLRFAWQRKKPRIRLKDNLKVGSWFWLGGRPSGTSQLLQSAK